VDITHERHPIEFDGFSGFGIAGDGRGWGHGELVGVCSFEVEGEAGLRIYQRNSAAEGDVFEIGDLAASQGSEERLISGEVNFATIIVGKAFGIIADFRFVASLVAVSWMRGDRDAAFNLSRGGAELFRRISALGGRGCRVERLGGKASHRCFPLYEFLGDGMLSSNSSGQV